MDGDQSESVRDWSSLSSDILYMLLNRLNDTETDCRRLRSVCTSWRSSIPPRSPLKFPVTIMLPFPSLFSLLSAREEENESGMLRQSIFYLIFSPVESSSTSSVWLTRVQEKPPPPNTYELLNPITPVDEIYYPLSELKVEVNFLDFRISEVARSYSLHGCLNELKSRKTVMLPKTGVTAENFCLLTIWNDNTLGLFEAGADEWVNIPTGCGNFSDIIAYEGIFYATDLKGRLISVDPMTFEVKEIIRSHSEAQESNKLFTYLVESCGRLYLVNKISNNSIVNEIKVFTLGYSCSANGECNHFWEAVTSLGDRVFFVSEYVTFSLTAQELGWDQGDCIFFTEEGFMGYGYYEYEGFEYNDDDFDLFSRHCGLYFVQDGRIITREFLPSEYTKTFWPIPSWLVSDNATHS